MSDLLRDSRLKVSRAEKHLADLKGTVQRLQGSYVSQESWEALGRTNRVDPTG